MQAAGETLPLPDDAVDVIRCRDVPVHVADLAMVLREGRRVLRPGGAMLIYQMFATDWLEAGEAARLWPPIGVHAVNTDPHHFDAGSHHERPGEGVVVPASSAAAEGAEQPRRGCAAPPTAAKPV